MYFKTGAALLVATLAMTSMETSAHAFGKRLSANGGNGGGLNLVLGNGNSVGNGGNGGTILSRSRSGGLAGLLGRRASANGGDGGSLNVVIGNNNRVGNGGRGGNILDIDD
jgi:hypothetical protein